MGFRFSFQVPLPTPYITKTTQDVVLEGRTFPAGTEVLVLARNLANPSVLGVAYGELAGWVEATSLEPPTS